jgi:hypothetical protein
LSGTRYHLVPHLIRGSIAAHLRGGSWNNNNVNARAANRNNNHPANRNNNIGFRVVVERPTPLVPLQWPVARAAGEPSSLYQSAAASSIAGRVSFASRGGELKEGAVESRPHGRNTPSGIYEARSSWANAPLH